VTDTSARFLGFAFASAELLFELDGDGRILIALGATQKLIGLKQDELVGQPWSRIFTPESRPVIAAVLDGLENADRRGPVRAELQPMQGRQLKRYVAFSACRLPQLAPNISCAISLTAGASLGAEPRGPMGLHDPIGFTAAAAGLMAAPPALDLDVAFIEFAGLGQAVTALDSAAARLALSRVAAAVKAESFAGQSAGQVAPDRFALVRSKADAPDNMLRRLSQAASRAGLDVQASGVNAALNPTPTGQSMRALRFALDSFIKEGPDAAGNAFAAVLAKTSAQARAFTEAVAEKRFRLAYQPIVDLKSGDLHHFEVLARLGEDDGSPASAIRMAEELHLIHDLDMAVADQAMRKMTQPGGGSLKLATNLSAQSLVKPGFIQSLLSKAQAFPGISRRLIFEITESAAMEDLEVANAHIQALRGKGFTVCLDDFGAGAAALSYLRSLSVDNVKIDGQYVRDIDTAGRADAVVRHLVELCCELEVTTVAEMVETQAAADILRDLGVDYGQGYLFGRPAPEPVYAKPTPRTARRVGAVETWN
jgi:EAL domain-containing protein (putative c-di-GMP-specific phosphodiesterase class I)